MVNVVFDMDGVLFDTQRIYYKMWFVVADRLGLSDITEPADKCIGTNRKYQYSVLYDFYGPEFPCEEFYALKDKLFAEYVEQNGVPLKKGTIELLEYLKNSGGKVAIASSSRRHIVENHLKQHDMVKYFDVIVGGDMIEKSKPAPDIYLKACELLGVAPRECYAVEDSYNGLISASDAGLKPVMVPDMLPYNDEIAPKVYLKFDSLLDFRDYLKKEQGL